MILTDVERKESLRIFSMLYAEQDYNTMVQYMPTEIDDPEGAGFSGYFDFLQSLYSIRSDIKSFDSEDDLDFVLENIYNKAELYKYPKNILEAFYG